MNCKNMETYVMKTSFGLHTTCVYCKKHPKWPIKINSIVKGCKEFIYK